MANAIVPMGGRHTIPPRGIADCVAQAIALANSEDEALYEHHGLDPRPWIGQAARWAKIWSQSGPWAAALPGLARQLARLEQLETDFARALEHEKLESLKELAYGAGHEINNPLANISARAQTLLPGEHDPDRRRLLAAIHAQAFRAHEMIADMMLFARPPQLQHSDVNLTGLLEKIVVELGPQAAAQQSELSLLAGPEPLNLPADATQLAVAIRAVCVNALEALANGGRVQVTLHDSLDSPPMVQIDIADDGPGIPENVRRHLFDPFYSGREAGRGLGFGLTKCWRIVTGHGGRMEVGSRPDGGTVFRILLPKSNDR
jgi:signal transduction histidine kinase